MISPESVIKVKSIAERLIGTTGGEAEDEIYELTMEECKYLDMLAFRCQTCEWWFSESEKSNEDGSGWYCYELFG